MAQLTTSTIPEQGQIVAVRQHRYVVTDVRSSALASLGEQPQHLVSLNSIEDDALGESLQVVWEIEPHARIDERVGLPEATGFDSPRKFDAFLNAVRWGAISSADARLLQAPFRSGITIEDYQLDPLVRAVQMPRANLLIADDVGLGKTIEAGLIVQELLLRNRARTVFIVCPSSLQIQWQDQMRDKFGLEFRIVDSDLMRELRRTRGLLVDQGFAGVTGQRAFQSAQPCSKKPLRIMSGVGCANGWHIATGFAHVWPRNALDLARPPLVSCAIDELGKAGAVEQALSSAASSNH